MKLEHTNLGVNKCWDEINIRLPKLVLRFSFAVQQKVVTLPRSLSFL